MQWICEYASKEWQNYECPETIVESITVIESENKYEDRDSDLMYLRHVFPYWSEFKCKFETVE